MRFPSINKLRYKNARRRILELTAKEAHQMQQVCPKYLGYLSYATARPSAISPANYNVLKSVQVVARKECCNKYPAWQLQSHETRSSGIMQTGGL